MADLKNKIEYLENGFVAGKPALEGQDSLSFIQEIINEVAADGDNYTKYKDKIGVILNASLKELDATSNDAKYILNSSIMKNLGITSTIKEENKTNIAIFEDYMAEKTDDEVFNLLDQLYSKSIDSENKRVEVSSLLALAREVSLGDDSKNIDPSDLLKRYFQNDNFTREGMLNVMAAAITFSNQSENFDYDLTQNQKDELKDITECFNKHKSSNKNLSDALDEIEGKFKKFFFSNDLDIEGQIHKLREEESLENSAGLISGRDIGDSVKQAVEQKRKIQDDTELEVKIIEWEKEYQNYLKSLGNIHIMSASEKFAKRFASHGFAPKTSSLFGDSIVMNDEYNDPKRTLWNVSSLTGTMKLSRDVNYHDADTCQKTFAIAALNARRNGWDTVYLNHPGPDDEAKLFIKESVTAMVEVGKYNFDEIHVPQKYKHVLAVLKEKYEASHAIIANAENMNVDTPNVVNDVNNSVVDEKNKDVEDVKSDTIAPSSPVTEIPNDFIDNSSIEPENLDDNKISADEVRIIANRDDDDFMQDDVSGIVPSKEDISNDFDIPDTLNDDGINYDYQEVDLNEIENGLNELESLDELNKKDNNNTPRRPRLFKNT